MHRAAVLCLALPALALAAAGCGSDRPRRGEGTVNVVATTVTLADLARNAGGRRVRVRAIVPRFADPHDWRPGAGTRAALEDADLVLKVGGELDSWLDAGDRRVLTLLPRLDPLGGDSHWWQDPVRVQKAVKEIRNELARVDVDGAGYYEAAAADYLARLRRLEDDTGYCLDVADARGARIATPHPGFRYFSQRYRVRIVDPRRGGAKLGRQLWADALGARGSRAGTYLGAFAANVATIADAVSGGKESCRPRT